MRARRKGRQETEVNDGWTTEEIGGPREKGRKKKTRMGNRGREPMDGPIKRAGYRADVITAAARDWSYLVRRLGPSLPFVFLRSGMPQPPASIHLERRRSEDTCVCPSISSLGVAWSLGTMASVGSSNNHSKWVRFLTDVPSEIISGIR